MQFDLFVILNSHILTGLLMTPNKSYSQIKRWSKILQIDLISGL